MFITSWIERIGQSLKQGARRKTGRREIVARASESLEQRSLLSAQALFVNGELDITLGATDSVAVRENPVAPGTVQVLLNGIPDANFPTVQASTVTRLLITGGDDENLIDLTGLTATVFNNPALSIEAHGGNGADTLLGSDSLNDSLDGGHGADSIVGNGGNDTLLGDDGNDTIAGGTGDDSIDAGDGQDTVDGNTGNDTILAGDGEDLIDGSAGTDNIDGGDGADTLRGGDDGDVINGGQGNDSLDGQNGDDSIFGGAGNDTLLGGSGADSVDGQGGNDLVYAEAVDGQAAVTTTVTTTFTNAVAFFTDFNSGAPAEITGTTTTVGVQGFAGLGTGTNTFGGNFLQNDTGGTVANPGLIPQVRTTLTLTNLPTHSSIDLNFLLAIINSFNGLNATTNFANDFFNVVIDGISLFRENFSNDGAPTFPQGYIPPPGVELTPPPLTDRGFPAGGANPNLPDSAWNMGLDPLFNNIPHTASTLTIDFFADGTGFEGGTNESWAIDNLEVILNGVPVVTTTITTIVSDDTLLGSTGNDTLNGADGNDLLNGGAGDDLIDGQNGNDSMLGGNGNDSIIGGDGDDTGRGQGGDDTLVGTTGADLMDGGTGNDLLRSGASTTVIVIPDLSINDATIVEGDAGTTALILTVSMSQTTTVPVSFQVATVDNVAQAGIDFTAVNTTVTIAPGQLTTTVTVPILGDTIFEADENFFVQLSNPVNSNLVDDFGVVTITNDDDVAATQFVFIDFDTATDGGDHVYTAAERTAILTRMGDIFDAFPVQFVTTPPTSGLFATLTINEPPPGGLAQELDFRNVNLGSSATVDLTPILGAAPSATYIELTAKVASHELGHLMGLRHNDSFGPIGTGLNPRVSAFSYNPPYPGPQNATETFNHIMTSPGSQNTSLAEELNNQFFGEREAIQLSAWAFGGQVLAEPTRAHGTIATAEPIQLRELFVPNTVLRGTNVGRTFRVNQTTVTGTISAGGERDVYSFEGTSGQILNLGVVSAVGIANRTNNTIDSFLRVLDGTGNPIPYYSGTAINNDSMDTGFPDSESVLIDLVIPTTGTFFIEVSAATAGDTGDYELYVFDFEAYTPAIAPPGAGGGGGPAPVPVDLGDTLLGGDGNDIIVGGDGDDVINAGGGNDTVFGGDGNDSILGGSGADSLDGQGGDDTLAGQGGKDTLIGGAGNDTFQWNAIGDGEDVVSSVDGFDQMQITASNAADTVAITKSGPRIQVTSGSNVLTVNPNISVISIDLGSGDDVLTVGDLSGVAQTVLTINGGDGNDTLDASAGVLGVVRLRLNGDVGNDRITGSANEDTIDGGAGNDSLLGGAGNDTIFGGADNDAINGQAGDDSITGDDGNDSLAGGDGNDTMRGGLGNDSLLGQNGDDVLDGAEGRDTLGGGEGNDALDGGGGKDYLTGGNGNDTLDGGRNDDTILGDAGNDTIQGNHGNDTINGGTGDDTISGGDGNDSITGGDGNDLVTGADGDDVLNGAAGNDTVTGGDGNDLIAGGAGSDVMLGDDGDDTLNGNGGTNTIAGGQGNDTIISLPTDVLNDSFVLSDDLLDKLDLL